MRFSFFSSKNNMVILSNKFPQFFSFNFCLPVNVSEVKKKMHYLNCTFKAFQVLSKKSIGKEHRNSREYMLVDVKYL